METRMNLFDTELGTKVGKRIYAVSQVIQGSPLPKSTQELVQLRASQINGCGFCVDVHGKDAAAAGEDPARLGLVAVWRHSSVFTDAERAALALAEEGTRISDTNGGVTDETWARVREHYDEEQAIALVSLVAMINAANRIGVILNNQGGSYAPGNLATLAS
ncbi:carboxymuconolactone decarboxylase family protein [Kitasatospora phosalacinea]|uniref:carboxymuconolactone decarboxylase family protein n=1 Tax=Kitasatospora phosalacinea TaxID=2065 RepID=UPI000524766C|nr:carboxymuconolactone decarboxylase family protein [Kitasatospora phosalacinea]